MMIVKGEPTEFHTSMLNWKEEVFSACLAVAPADNSLIQKSFQHYKYLKDLE